MSIIGRLFANEDKAVLLRYDLSNFLKLCPHNILGLYGSIRSNNSLGEPLFAEMLLIIIPISLIGFFLSSEFNGSKSRNSIFSKLKIFSPFLLFIA